MKILIELGTMELNRLGKKGRWRDGVDIVFPPIQTDDELSMNILVALDDIERINGYKISEALSVLKSKRKELDTWLKGSLNYMLNHRETCSLPGDDEEIEEKGGRER